MTQLYSARLSWHTQPNRLSELRAWTRDFLDLTISNPTQAGIEYPSDLTEALSDPRSLQYDPHPAGLLATREAVCRFTGAPSPDRVLLTASTSEAYSYLFKLFCDPGDEVLVPRPSYPLFEMLAALDSVKVVPYTLFYDGRWSIDELPITSRTRAIVAVSPNNPTGSLADVGALRQRNLPVIVDEVFAPYAPPQQRFDDAFYLNGLSKLAGLPQMKLGWIIHPAEHRDALELIADTYLSVSAPVQYAAIRWLEIAPAIQKQIAERCAVNERTILQTLHGTALTPLQIDGGWTLPIEIPRTRPEEDVVCDLLSQHGVLVQPGYFYDFPREAFLIVSLLTQPDILEEGLRRIVQALNANN